MLRDEFWDIVRAVLRAEWTVAIACYREGVLDRDTVLKCMEIAARHEMYRPLPTKAAPGTPGEETGK